MIFKRVVILPLLIFTFLAIAVLSSQEVPVALSKIEVAVSNSSTQNTTIPFEYVEVDGSVAGDCKMVGDIDGDGLADLVIGGMPGENLNWYRNSDWHKTVIAIPGTEFTTDGALGDVDGDGDLDIVVPDGVSGDNVLWFENPRPTGDPAIGSQWTRHAIGAIGSWGKDVELADFDGNNRLDVATRTDAQTIIFYQTAADSWVKVDLGSLTAGQEGMASGDINGDGNVDLVLQGVWVRNPGGDAARTGSNWNEYTIGSAPSTFKALVTDLNLDGKMDVLFSSSEGTADVNWWTPTNNDPTGSWTKQTIIYSLERAHTLQAADMDKDGDKDVVLAQMHTSSAQEIIVMENVDGLATTWQKQIVDTGGIHNGVVADIDNDGDFDIYGANWTGNPPVKLWINQSGTTNVWTYKEVTNANQQTFGLGFYDVNRDGILDIVSGQHWYRNPGGDMMGTWSQHTFPSGMHVFTGQDVDGDNLADLIAQKDEGDIALYWLEATDEQGLSWNAVAIGTVDQASHTYGAQGYGVAQIEAGGAPEILISSGAGIYYFRIPANPNAGSWPRVHVNSNPSDEGFAVGDIDRDNDLDIAATTGDSKRVEWYRNPGDGSENWDAFHIGTFDNVVFPDRTELADVNNDNRLDIIVSEENGVDSGAETRWWQAPQVPTDPNWTGHLITTQATTNSMDTVDIDGDNDIDVILAEHRGSKKLAIWVNDGSGGLTEQLISTGYESHLGAQAIDLDADGDYDIASIAWDDSQFIHLWRNDGQGSGVPTPTPSPTPPVPGPTPSPTPIITSRIYEGLKVLYQFENGSGTTVSDVSGMGTPMDLSILNAGSIEWITGGGLALHSGTILVSSDAAKLYDACSVANEITIEAWIQPDNIGQDGPARIVTFSTDPLTRNFTLGQENSQFDIRLRTTGTSENGIPSLTTPADTANTKLTHVVFTRAADATTRVYVDGVVITTGTLSGSFSNWDADHTFALGNEISMDRPWLGELHLVAIYCRALSSSEVIHNFELGAHPEEPVLDNSVYLPMIKGASNAFLSKKNCSNLLVN